MANEKVRLQKYLALKGVASRRASEQMILDGRVKVNNIVIDTMGMKIDPKTNKVKVDNQLITGSPRLRYILLYKPAGYICSVQDERGRRTVLDLLDNIEQRIYPVGRLDYNTSGLLLLTNDGDLTNKLLHPSHQIVKTYLAVTDKIPDQNALNRLRQGVRLSDGMTAPAKAKITKRSDTGAVVEIKIHEGRNRQVRRMLETLGLTVQHLRRSAVAFLDLTGLQPGEWRELNDEEISALKKL